jgi:hypothetical protein
MKNREGTWPRTGRRRNPLPTTRNQAAKSICTAEGPRQQDPTWRTRHVVSAPLSYLRSSHVWMCWTGRIFRPRGMTISAPSPAWSVLLRRMVTR